MDTRRVIKAKFDMPRLERSLKRFSEKFGETSAQAVVRWSVQVCRELAFETQAFGTKSVKKKQENAMLRDAYNVLFVCRTMREKKSAKSGGGYLASIEKG